MFLAAISTAGVLLLLPIAILRLLAIRDRRDGVILAALAAGLAIQIGLSWGKTTLLGEAPGIQLALEPHWSWELVPAYFQRIAGGVVGGQWINGNLWEQLGTPTDRLARRAADRIRRRRRCKREHQGADVRRTGGGDLGGDVPGLGLPAL